MDVLRSAAIIGVVMALSHIFEQYIILFSGIGILTTSLVVCIEGLIAAVAFVWLMFYFTRRMAKMWTDKIDIGDGRFIDAKFTYGRAVSYAMMISMLTGVMVGVASTIFIDSYGYDVYRAALIQYFNEVVEMANAYSSMSGGEDVVPMSLLDDNIATIEAMERPSVFENIISHMTSYMFYGGVVALVVAAVARLKIKRENESAL